MPFFLFNLILIILISKNFMYISQNASFVPNLLTSALQSDTDCHKKRTKPFKESTNRIVNRLKNKQNMDPSQKQNIQAHKHQQNNNQNLKMNKNVRKNILIDFQFQFEEDGQQEESIQQKKVYKKQQEYKVNSQLNEYQFQVQESQVQFMRPDLKKNVLLQFQSQEQGEGEQIVQAQEQGNNNSNEEQQQTTSQQDSDTLQTKIICLKKHISLTGIKYYIEPIQKLKTLQLVIKRQKDKDGIKYHIFDSATLFNFMTVVKDQDGYIFINKITSSPSDKKFNVVAKLVSNFFGTEFNCYLMDAPYKTYCSYGINSKVHKNQITIQYQTNILGLKGPREMTAYIRKNKEKTTMNKSLNEIYCSQKKKNLPRSIEKYKNKTPKWNNQINSFVLNFHGRATESSIKNFIMIREDEKDNDDDRLLFGKFGKEIFNLDISYPFNLVQAVSLAMSSFDRKLACQ